MKLSRLLFPAVALVGAVGLVSSNAPSPQRVDHAFSTPPVNAKGLRSLSELRGKPIIVDFWGTR